MRYVPVQDHLPLQARLLPEDLDQTIQLLDEHHLVVTGGERSARERLADQLRDKLALLSHTRVLLLDGEAIVDLASFIRAICDDDERRDLLSPLRGIGSGYQRAYCIWNDAQVMLQRDPALFSQIINAFLGIAAELEHVSLDPLVLQRLICIGDASLGAFAQSSQGPFARWLTEEGHTPFWEVASVVDRPPVVVCQCEG